MTTRPWRIHLEKWVLFEGRPYLTGHPTLTASTAPRALALARRYARLYAVEMAIIQHRSVEEDRIVIDFGRIDPETLHG